jgi:hypothetical protein
VGYWVWARQMKQTLLDPRGEDARWVGGAWSGGDHRLCTCDGDDTEIIASVERDARWVLEVVVIAVSA